MSPGQAVSFGAVPDLEGLPGVHIECKRVERLNIPEAMGQAVRDSEKFKDGTHTKSEAVLQKLASPQKSNFFKEE